MKKSVRILLIIMSVAYSGCTSTKTLQYFSNLPAGPDPQFFALSVEDYKIQYRDLLYVDVKAMTTEGKIENILQGTSISSQSYIQSETSQYLIGYNVDKEGMVLLPLIGRIKVGGKTINEIKNLIQENVDSVFNHAYVDVKLLSFRFTVLGEARNPGSFVNYSDYITVLEAIGKAGGISDYGRRDEVLLIRTTTEGSTTCRLNLKDKSLLTSSQYFLKPNDVIIIEPVKNKIFNLNLPTISFILSSVTSIITTTLLMINYFKNE